MMSKIGRMGLAVSLMLSVAGRRLPAQAPNPIGTNLQNTAKKPETPRVTATDSIVVGAHLTPEEIEDEKIEDVSQPLYHWKQSTDCPKIVELCETKIIPMAENSKFEGTKNKFLFLANENIAGCEMKAGQYNEAEQRYLKLLDHFSTSRIRVTQAIRYFTAPLARPASSRTIGKTLRRRWSNL